MDKTGVTGIIMNENHEDSDATDVEKKLVNNFAQPAATMITFKSVTPPSFSKWHPLLLQMVGKITDTINQVLTPLISLIL